MNLNLKLNGLSNNQLIESTKKAVSEERAKMEAVLLHLAEIEKRKLYFECGCTSLHVYCTKVLGYSDGAAYHRVKATHLLLELSPKAADEIRESLKTGSLELTHLSKIQSVSLAENMNMKQKQDLLKQAEGKSTRDLERVLAVEVGAPLPKERIKPVSETHSQLTVNIDQETEELLKRFKELTARTFARK